MTKQMIEDLKPGEPVDSVFLVGDCALRATRNGDMYLTLSLRDRTGGIEGRMWGVNEEMGNSVAVDDFVTVKGRAESYKNDIQINVRSITTADTAGLSLRDFLPQCPRDVNEMLAEFTAILDTVEDPDYRKVVDAFMTDEKFVKAFISTPAAVSNHHAYLGGLLEHTLSMAGLAAKICEHYSELRRDLLLTAVLLHDAGKTRELACKRTFQYTPSGQLIGHIVMGVMMLEEKVRQLEDFPEDKFQMLSHLILSHHGELEYGAAKLPCFAEAFALHHIDNIDAKIKEVAEILEADKNGDSLFTDYTRLFKRRLYKG